MDNKLKEKAIADGLIDEQFHMPLLADLTGYARTAGIPEHFVWTSVRDYCGEKELEYILDLRRSLQDNDGKAIGMLYVGDIEGAAINERMMSIAGVCLRHYINAKVMTLQAVLTAMKAGSMPTNVSVLLIPNFYDHDCQIAKWQVHELLGMLYQRQQDSKHTVLHITDIDDLGTKYGDSFRKHLSGRFAVITS